jgi:hypothetical protein
MTYVRRGRSLDLNPNEWVEVRMALEFPIAATPAAAPIHRVTLSLYHPTEMVWIRSRCMAAGNGLIEAADVVVTCPRARDRNARKRQTT